VSPLPSLRPALAVLLACAGAALARGAPSNSDCLACHERPAVDQKSAEPDANAAIETLRAVPFAHSVHGQLQCVDCHATIKDIPHDDKLPPVQCATCHAAEAKAYAGSIHGMSNAMGASAAATCTSCHGVAHEIVPVTQKDSPVAKQNLPQTCSACHGDPKLIAAYRMNAHTGDYYRDSIHGQALLNNGNLFAPSCNNCHGVHDIKRSVDQSSRTNRANLAATCGQCHAKIEATYRTSVHGLAVAKGNPAAPVCIDCHTAHQIEAPTTSHFKAESDQICGRCHQDRLANYRDTYHGKAMALARPDQASDVKVAACYDCHGAHDVFPPSDPRSLLSPAHIVSTCQQCHPGVNAKFTEYRPHADPLDKVHYPLFHYVLFGMTGLLLGVFGFFGLHTVLWLGRSLRLYLNDTKAFREAAARTRADVQTITRFTPYERFLHVMVVTSFLLLVLTGMPLKFYYAPWARRIFAVLGGVEHARLLHRLGAIVTFGYFALHLVNLAARLWRKRAAVRSPATGRYELRRILGAIFGPDSLVPSLQDLRDFIAHVKWFLGRGPKPQFDRWTYWEKFDYMAVFWGVFMIGVSGLMMWFPKFFTLFLPGWMINVSLLIHSDEALLAAGFIFTVHFFNTHFRVERFPMDTVIFSGNITQTELLHERKKWYDRLVASGKLNLHAMPEKWKGRRPIAKALGFAALLIGLALLGLIIYAMLSRLL
jgi:cytochrome b subunit of formate dehydrogenase